MKNRTKYTSIFKATIVLDAITNKSNIKNIATQNKISVQQINRWKKYFLKNANKVFENIKYRNQIMKDIM